MTNDALFRCLALFLSVSAPFIVSSGLLLLLLLFLQIMYYIYCRQHLNFWLQRTCALNKDRVNQN